MDSAENIHKIFERDCEYCIQDNKKIAANGECKQCEQYICNECFRQHRKSTVCKDHELYTFTEEESSFVIVQKAECKENNTRTTHERDKVKSTTAKGKTIPGGANRKVYLLDQECGDTTKQFTDMFAARLTNIELVPVHTIGDCKENYPIALLCRRQTDRAADDIESVLENIHKEHYARIALINIHVASSDENLPLVPTAEKTSEFHDIGRILDFGYIPSKRPSFISTTKFHPCKNSEGVSSLKVFENFVKSICRKSSSR